MKPLYGETVYFMGMWDREVLLSHNEASWAKKKKNGESNAIDSELHVKLLKPARTCLPAG